LSAKLGYKSHLQLGTEPAWGTPAAPTLSLPFINESFKPSRETVESASIRGTRGQSDGTDGIYDCGGSFSFEVDPDNICFILKHAMGAPQTTYAGDGAYEHVFTLKDTLQSMTGEVDRDGFVFQVLGAMIESLHFSEDGKGILKCEVGCDAWKDMPYNYSTAVYSTAKPFNFKDVGMGALINSTPNYYIKGFDLSLANNNKKDYRSYASGIFRGDIPVGRAKINGSLPMNFETDEEFIRFWGDAGGPIKDPATNQLQTTFLSNQQIGTSQYYKSIMFYMGNVRYESVDAGVKGPEPLDQTIPYRAFETAAGLANDLQITVVNGMASF